MADLVPERRPREQDGTVARRDIRVSDGERQAVVDELREHCGAGRLELDELEERTSAALSARVRGELEPLLDDLPELHPPAPATGPPVRARTADRPVLDAPAFRVHRNLWIVFSVFMVAIWVGIALVGGASPFWPVFPIAATGLTVGVHAAVRKGVA
ncbi:MAG TPA: DUF1707 domain-containing protein [Acidimicrobiales bacterium]